MPRYRLLHLPLCLQKRCLGSTKVQTARDSCRMMPQAISYSSYIDFIGSAIFSCTIETIQFFTFEILLREHFLILSLTQSFIQRDPHSIAGFLILNLLNLSFYRLLMRFLTRHVSLAKFFRISTRIWVTLAATVNKCSCRQALPPRLNKTKTIVLKCRQNKQLQTVLLVALVS